MLACICGFTIELAIFASSFGIGGITYLATGLYNRICKRRNCPCPCHKDTPE